MFSFKGEGEKEKKREGNAKQIILSQVPLGIIYGGKIVEMARRGLKMVEKFNLRPTGRNNS